MWDVLILFVRDFSFLVEIPRRKQDAVEISPLLKVENEREMSEKYYAQFGNIVGFISYFFHLWARNGIPLEVQPNLSFIALNIQLRIDITLGNRYA
jgi:hypothetical protein